MAYNCTYSNDEFVFGEFDEYLAKNLYVKGVYIYEPPTYDDPGIQTIEDLDVTYDCIIDTETEEEIKVTPEIKDKLYEAIDALDYSDWSD